MEGSLASMPHQGASNIGKKRRWKRLSELRLQLTVITLVLLAGGFSLRAQDTLICSHQSLDEERIVIVTEEHELVMKTFGGKRNRVVIEEMNGDVLKVRPKYRTRQERKERRLAERAIRKDTTLTPAQLREKVEFLGRPTTREIPLGDVELLITFNKYNPAFQKRLKTLSIANMVLLWGGIPAMFLFPTSAYVLSWTAAGSGIVTAYLLTERKRVVMEDWRLQPIQLTN